ncbi:MAG: hypothetical protein WA484_08885 [Solirubrobacteraceae bacterium]
MAVAVTIAVVLGVASSAIAAGGAVWKITSFSNPTHLWLPAGEKHSGILLVHATNVGESSDGSPVRIDDVLPAGLTVVSISGRDVYGPALSCAALPALTCTDSSPVPTGDTLELFMVVDVQPGAASSVVNRARVSGGGTEGVSVESPITISQAPNLFGVNPESVVTGLSTMQAGAHPNVTTAYMMNASAPQFPVYNAKDVRFDLPRGLVGNTVGMPTCELSKMPILFSPGECPSDTIVGVASVWLQSSFSYSGNVEENGPVIEPVYNIKPSPGEPAAFSFPVLLIKVRLDTSVLSNGDYGVRVTAGGLSEAQPVLGAAVTIWGVPADHQGPGSIPVQEIPPVGGPNTVSSRVSLLSNPTQCSTPLSGTLSVDSWVEPGVFTAPATSPVGTLMGCDQLPFVASASMLPDTLQAGAPAGYTFHLHVNQSNRPEALATPNIRKVVTTLPMGTAISPSAAWGLTACSDALFGLHSGVPSECPREAQVGTLTITAPALPEPFSGRVFLAAPDCGPCSPEDAQDGKMVRLFMEAIAEGESGIIVKLEGKGQVNQQTGQLSVTFDENPQLPFSDLKLSLGGGPRATLANPRTCGTATTTVDLMAWSSPFTQDQSPTSPFEPTGCYAPQFSPSFVAGTTNIQAGEYSPFTVSFGRQDSDEFLNGLQMHMPPGVIGSVSGVPLCKEPQAAEGTCAPESLIGHTQVLTGPGADPFLVTGGQVFLTEGYRGAPFGLSIVVPAKAGPYTLSGTTGKGTVVVRAAINIDSHTSALTVTSDPLPTMLDGIPLQLRVVNVTVDRPNFTVNPTNCDKLAITGTLTSKESAGVTVSSPFQVTNCQGLGFNPKFKVSTSGHTSRANGASLDAKVIYPTGAKLANVAKVKVELPRQLPSRLSTLQKACPAATFDANPAACPSGSVVGIAKAITPIVPVELTGPVYFVSHGGEAFPNLIIVLQGYGVRVDLVGDTFISKAGITSSTFNQIPDVPTSSVELYLPQGPGSALAANGNLCTQSLTMPTTFIAQNGAVLHQATRIAVTGCRAAISVLAHSVKGNTATITVHVPSAGVLVASRAGLSRATGKAGAAGTVTVTLALSSSERRFLSRHPGRRLKVHVKLLFTPEHGSRLSSAVTLLMR